MTSNVTPLPDAISGLPRSIQIGYAANQAFFKISDILNIDHFEQARLFGLGLLRVENLRSNPAQTLPKEQLLRIWCLVQIFKTLMQKNQRDPSAVKQFLRTPIATAPFYRKSPYDLMQSRKTIGLVMACEYLTGQLPPLSGDPENQEYSV